jgi:hypothetical protein
VCARYKLKETGEQVSSILESCRSKLMTIEPGESAEDIRWKIDYAAKYTDSAIRLLAYSFNEPGRTLSTEPA